MALIHLQSSRTSSSKTSLSSFQRQDSTADDCEAYGADRHAAAALRDLTVRSRYEKYGKLKSEPLKKTLDVDAMQKTSKTKRVYKKRKATHTVRKEEMQMLELELTKLQKELRGLEVVDKGDENQSDEKARATSTLLRETVQKQHLVLARAQAMLAGHAQQSRYRFHPTEMKIRLGTDRNARRRTLSALRKPKLEEARRFLMERTRGLSPIAPYLQEERYDTMDGDYCIARFDVTPFRGAKSVQDVFSALQHAIFNAEIIISESSGNITIREDDELGDDDLSHMRFLSQTPLGVQLETNLVLFSDRAQYQTKNESFADNGCYAIMASDFVDEDTKYPYKPNERIRRDSTTVTMVTSYRDHTAGVEDDEGEIVVVATRWALNIVRRPTISVSSDVWDDLRNFHLRLTDLWFNCVRQALGLPVFQ